MRPDSSTASARFLANGGTMKLPRVILADDHKILVEAFRKLLEPYCDVVATVADGRALLDVAAALNPDVILLDIGMPILNGLQAGRQLKSKMPSVKLIFLTMQEDPDLAVGALGSGASGYLLKTSTSSELLHAIREALRGRSYVTPQIARGMEQSFMRDPTGRPRPKLPTPRQCEVIQLLVEGKTMKKIADVLQVTARTVAFHKYKTMQDLGLTSNAKLIQFAIKNHIVAA
jgi:DNA-binding NarL/FixJ family response regulator